MKALILCPAERRTVGALSESGPLSNVMVFGKTVLEHWFEHLASAGAKHVRLIVVDGHDQIAESVGDGSRWGVSVRISPEAREQTVRMARYRYRPKREDDWLAAPNEIVLADHLPGMAERDIFWSYRSFFGAVMCWLPEAVKRGRVGLHEIKPGVWAGLRTEISRHAVLRPPVWIGDDVRIRKNVIIGPNAIIEDRALIEEGAEIVDSHVGPKTFVGEAIRVASSIAMGSTLVNWEWNSVTKVPDPFLLSSLEPERIERRVMPLITVPQDTQPEAVPQIVTADETLEPPSPEYGRSVI